jgi:hypothetical protein
MTPGGDGALNPGAALDRVLRRRGLFQTKVGLGPTENRAASAVEPENGRRQKFFGTLLGVAIGMAVVAVALTISQHWPLR